MPKLPSQISTGVHNEHDKFFRGRLLIQDVERIAKSIEGMEKEAGAIREEALKMCWYMRGGLTYEEAMNLSPKEREAIGRIVKENLETTKKTGMAFF